MADAAPGIFTWNLLYGTPGLGLDRAFIYNEDRKQNTPSDPALRDSMIILYATGDGQSDPAGMDGKLSAEPLSKPLLPVSVRIGEQEAAVLHRAHGR